MAGQKSGNFRELLSPFLSEKLDHARRVDGPESTIARILERQYKKDPREDQSASSHERRRHYEAEVHATYKGKPLLGVERLYGRVLLIEPTTICAAHCRWCLRGQYPILNLSEEQLDLISRYCGDHPDVNEVLITGGDPLMVPDLTTFLLDCLEKNAPNIRIARLGSRVPVQDPSRVNEKLLSGLSRRKLRVEIGTHVNHASELFPEVREAHRRLSERGIAIYNQSVLLKGVNDTIQELVDLYDELRALAIEAHYLFHGIPIRGMNHHRTTLRRSLELVRGLSTSGRISGRGKPIFAVMTDIGKITPYEGSILKRDQENRVLLQSHYSQNQFKEWNPSWRLPESAEVGQDGLLRVWYLDGEE